MRNIFFTFLILSSFLVKGTTWFDIGIKGGYGITAPINSNILDDKTQTYKIFHGGKTSYTYGAKVAINFNPIYSISTEVNFSTLNPMYTSSIITVPTFKITQIPIIYRKNNDIGGYIEVGPQISLIKSVTAGDNDVTGEFVKSSYDLVIGGGQYIGGASAFGFNLGFRATMPLVDINADKTDRGFAIYKPSIEAQNFYQYKPYRNLFVSIILEFNLNFGYLQHGPSCHPGTRFKLF